MKHLCVLPSFRVLFLLLLLAQFQGILAQPQSFVDRGYGGLVWEELNDGATHFDGHFVFAGLTSSPISGDVQQANQGIFDYWLIKVDTLLNPIWSQRYGGNGQDRLWSMDLTQDGGFILGGHSTSDATGDKTGFNRGNDDFWIIKTDSLGNQEWDQTYGSDSIDLLYDILQTPDGGYIMAGMSQSGIGNEKTDTARGGWDWWIIRTDSLGAIQWQRTIGGPGNDRLNMTMLSDDGGYYFGGSTQSDQAGDISTTAIGTRDFLFMKLDDTGNIVWERRYGGLNEDEINRIVQTADGGFLLAGSSRSDIGGDKSEAFRGSVDMWVVKTNNAGTILWDKTLGTTGLENAYLLLENPLQQIMVGGFSSSDVEWDKTEPSRGGFDYWVVFMDEMGNVLWDKTLGGPANDILTDVIVKSDGGFLFMGHSSSDLGSEKTFASYGLNDIWVLSTNCPYQVDLGPDTTICFGDGLFASAFQDSCSNCLYRWNDGATNSDRVLAPLVSTEYSVQVYDSLGCFSFDTIFIAVQNLPSINSIPDTSICPGTVALITPQTNGTIYQWSTGDSTLSLVLDTAQSYTFTALDSIQCQQSETFLISWIDIPEFADTTITCDVLNTTYTVEYNLEGGNSASYQIMGDPGIINGNTFISNPILSGDSYFFALQDGAGCNPVISSDSFSCPCFTQAGGFPVDTTMHCGSGTISLPIPSGLVLDSNDIIIFYLHDGPNFITSNRLDSSLSPGFNFNSALSYGQVYYISAVAGYGSTNNTVHFGDACLSVSNASPVLWIAPPLATINLPDSSVLTCGLPQLTLDGSGSTPPGGLTIFWDASFFSLDTGLVFQTNTPGVFHITHTEPLAQCSDTVTVSISQDTISPQAIIQTPDTIQCDAPLLTLNAGLSSGPAGFVYNWSGPGFVDQSNVQQVLINQSGTYTLILENVFNQCLDSAEVFVAVDTIHPQIQLAKTNDIDCIFNHAMVQAFVAPDSVTKTLNWSSPDGIFSVGLTPDSIKAISEGIYLVQVTFPGNGCSSTSEIVVFDFTDPPQDLSAEITRPNCTDIKSGKILISSVSGGTPPYQFSLDGSSLQSDSLFANLSAGTYRLRIVDNAGCVLEEDLVMPPAEMINLDLGPDQSIELGQSVTIQANSNIPFSEIQSISWSPQEDLPCQNCIDFSFFPEKTLQISAVLEDLLGCMDSDTVQIIVSKPDRVFIPNVFSPDFDGFNDYFRVFTGADVSEIEEVLVFNRWGSLLYKAQQIKTADIADWWDGSFRGKPVDPGVYVYMVRLRFIDGREALYKGDVLLVR